MFLEYLFQRSKHWWQKNIISFYTTRDWGHLCTVIATPDMELIIQVLSEDIFCAYFIAVMVQRTGALEINALIHDITGPLQPIWGWALSWLSNQLKWMHMYMSMYITCHIFPILWCNGNVLISRNKPIISETIIHVLQGTIDKLRLSDLEQKTG